MNKTRTTTSSSRTTTSSSGTTTWDTWSLPTLVETIVNHDSIEQVFKQTSMITLTINPSPPPEEQVYKIVYSCKEGKWHVSDPIYGEIIPEQEETYTF